MGSVQSDEEIARQLQQEEWEAAHPYGGRGHNSRTGRGGAFNSFHYPFRRVSFCVFSLYDSGAGAFFVCVVQRILTFCQCLNYCSIFL